MPAGDTFRFAEERRLFYVALTRARRSVLLVTLLGRESPFIVELVKDGHLTVVSASGDEITLTPCPRCKVGRLVERVSKYGPFLSCSTFPKCDYKIDKAKAAAAGARSAAASRPPRRRT